MSQRFEADWWAFLGHVHQSGADTVIQVDTAETLTRKNVALPSLTQSHVSFVQ